MFSWTMSDMVKYRAALWSFLKLTALVFFHVWHSPWAKNKFIFIFDNIVDRVCTEKLSLKKVKKILGSIFYQWKTSFFRAKNFNVITKTLWSVICWLLLCTALKCILTFFHISYQNFQQVHQILQNSNFKVIFSTKKHLNLSIFL